MKFRIDKSWLTGGWRVEQWSEKVQSWWERGFFNRRSDARIFLKALKKSK